MTNCKLANRTRERFIDSMGLILLAILFSGVASVETSRKRNSHVRATAAADYFQFPCSLFFPPLHCFINEKKRAVAEEERKAVLPDNPITSISFRKGL
jgi:hypothetical protein